MNKWCFKPRFCTVRLYTGPGTTGTNEIKFVMNYAPGAGSIVLPVYWQSSVPPMCYGCPIDKGRKKVAECGQPAVTWIVFVGVFVSIKSCEQLQ